MADEVQGLMGRWFRREPNKRTLVLCGETGTGKTLCMRRCMSNAMQVSMHAYEMGNWSHPPSAHFEEWPRVAAAVEELGENMMNDLYDCGILFLDEVGAESDRFRSGRAVDLLASVLNRRIDKKERYTVITTNVLPEHWMERWDVRIEDRLLRGSSVVDLRNVPRFTEVMDGRDKSTTPPGVIRVP